MVPYKSLKTKEKSSWVIQKWSRPLTGEVTYESGQLRERSLAGEFHYKV